MGLNWGRCPITWCGVWSPGFSRQGVRFVGGAKPLELLGETVSDRLKPGLVRLRAHWNSRVKVPDLANTEGPATESNCLGAIPPGGELLEVNHRSEEHTSELQ